MRDQSELRNYQKLAIDFILEEVQGRPVRPSGLLFQDMGLGKTIELLTVVKMLFDEGVLGRGDAALVIAPLRVTRLVWMQEAAGWKHTAGLKVVRVMGNSEQRMRALCEPADVYVINAENTPWLFRAALSHLIKLKGKFPWSFLIIDETKGFRKNSTERFKAIRYKLKHFARRWVLTGTPTPRRLQDLWAQVFIADEGQRLGTAFDRFQERFFIRMDYEGRTWEPRDGAKEYILNLVKDIAMSMDADDWLELPPVLENPVKIVLPEDVRETYDRFEREMFINLADGKQITAFSAAALSGKCHQLANGAVYDDPDLRTSYHTFHDAKMEALDEIMEETSSNMMIAYNFRHDLDRICKEWDNVTVFENKRLEELEAAWNRGEIPRLAVHPQSSGHGLNLQGGGFTLAMFSQTWNAEDFWQLIYRLRRSGQKSDHIDLHLIMAEDTTDDAIYWSNVRKSGEQRGVLQALNRYKDIRELLS